VCRFLSELSMVPDGYSSWEAQRVQKCQCDGGFQGADCSERICPMGDDPETICAYTDRQVQEVKLEYLTLPFGFTGSDDSDEMSLVFTAGDGSFFSTPTISSFWSDAATGAANLKTALESLPQMAVSEVKVSGSREAAGADPTITYLVTFSGATNTGNEKLLTCPFHADGYSLGCTSAGCQPKYKQPRLLKTDIVAGRGVEVSSLSHLQQPPAVEGGNVEGRSGEWGVETSLQVTTDAAGLITYAFTDTSVWGSPDPDADTLAVAVPPSSLRSSVEGPYGLLVDFSADDAVLELGFPAGGSVLYTIKWSLPKCSVKEVTAAADDLEKAECSNRGVCDRTAGVCGCFPGYSGSACDAQVICESPFRARASALSAVRAAPDPSSAPLPPLLADI